MDNSPVVKFPLLKIVSDNLTHHYWKDCVYLKHDDEALKFMKGKCDATKNFMCQIDKNSKTLKH